ncbi:ATP-binding protein [Nocardioides eburneiflavus]|nr:ATP-binding protein [Nocardioides eburneiflavus]
MEGAPGRRNVQLAADPVSVPAARRFVVDTLAAWGEGRHAEDAELVTSELTGNAALHAGARFMYVTVERSDQAAVVRVAVEDDGPVGADALHVRTPALADDPLEWADLPATGRGLAIVATLAAAWGVEETPRGKRVWADLAGPGAVSGTREPRRSLTHDAAMDEELPPGWTLVRLAGCPVALSLEQDRHLDELVRELQLLGADEGRAESTALAHEIRDLLVSPAHARVVGRRTAERARDEGKAAVDVEMAMPSEFSALIVRLQSAVVRADELCEDGLLLTLASPPQVRELRAWMTHEIVAQAERGEPPTPWSEWRDGSRPS